MVIATKKKQNPTHLQCLCLSYKEKMQKMQIPLKKHGFFKGTPEAWLLMAQTLTGLAVLSGAVDSVSPIQVLLWGTVRSRMVLGLTHQVLWVFRRGTWEPICGSKRRKKVQEANCCNEHCEYENWGSGFLLHLWVFVDRHWCCRGSVKRKEETDQDWSLLPRWVQSV